MLRRLSLLFIVLVALSSGTLAQDSSATLFQYPSIPDSITSIDARYNYYVAHFWDRAPRSSMFSSKQRFEKSFEDYISPMRFADMTVVENSIAAFMKLFEKKPERQLYIVRLAEDKLYGDSARMWSDDLYTAFIRPLLDNKKVDKTMKSRYRLHMTQLENSMLGKPVVQFDFIASDGSKGKMKPTPGAVTVIFFNDPECSDCDMARIRLAADIRANDLLKQGRLAVYSISVCEPDDEWRSKVGKFPSNWTKGASPDIDLELDMRGGTPSFYLIDENGNLAAKHIDIDQLLQIIGRL